MTERFWSEIFVGCLIFRSNQFFGRINERYRQLESSVWLSLVRTRWCQNRCLSKSHGRDSANSRFLLRRKPLRLALRSRIASDDNPITGDTDHFDGGSMIDVSTIADDIQVLVAEHCLSGWTQS